MAPFLFYNRKIVFCDMIYKQSVDTIRAGKKIPLWKR